MVFHMVMSKVVWVLGTTTFDPINMIVGLIVVIFFHLRVLIIHPKVIQKNTVTIIHNIGECRINLSLMVIMEVVLVLGPPTYPAIKLTFIRGRHSEGFSTSDSHYRALTLVSYWIRDYPV